MSKTKDHNAYLFDWIIQTGPIRFDLFMDWALYDPIYGYYNQSPGMSGRDFITAPEMGSLFSDALIHLIKQLDLNCNHLVELGPGTGALMTKLKDQFNTQFEQYHLVEISSSLKKIQSKKTDEFSHIGLDQIPNNSLIIANEWLDALPSRRVKLQDGKLFEAYIDVADNKLVWQWKETTLTLEHWPKVDGIYDVRDYTSIFQTLKSSLQGSTCIWFDYGYHANELMHLPHLGDSLRGFYKNTVEGNVLKHIGHMDLTVDVNFSTLAHQAADHGWLISNYFKQSHWIIDYLMYFPNRQNHTWEVRQLTDPSEMGERIRCLIFSDPAIATPRLRYDECVRL